jgi:lysophospholipase L1-like esterase
VKHLKPRLLRRSRSAECRQADVMINCATAFASRVRVRTTTTSRPRKLQKMIASRLVGVIAIALCCACCSGGNGGKPSPPFGPVPEPPPGSPEARRVFIGDSLTALWGTNAPGINVGIPEQTTDEMLERFQHDVLERHPAVVVILGGTNDVYRQETPSINNVARMASMAAASSACVIVGTLPPVFKSADLELTLAHQQKWNSEIRRLAADHGYLVADYRPAMEGKRGLFGDGIHPNQAGYQVMLTVIEPVLQECDARSSTRALTNTAVSGPDNP